MIARSSALPVADRGATPTNALVVAKDPAPEFDPGPLSWVQREIDQALAKALESLAAFSKPERDGAALKAARTHVHQAAGAIRMVGLVAVAEFTREIEHVLSTLEDATSPGVDAVSPVVERACRKLSIFLGELASGAPPAALKLYPEYEAMQRTRGLKAVTPTDLFYPDLRIRAPKMIVREAVPESRIASHLAKKRRMYEGGLLQWLRGDAGGARTMRDAVTGIEAVAAQENMRAFWWTVRALLEAMAEHGFESGPDIKHLAARIDLQIRRVLEGGAMVADRLRREVLYYVAISAPVGPTVRAVQRAFRLSSLIPAHDPIAADFATIEPRLREGRERLAGIKETWLNFASGRAENLAKLKQALAIVHARATELRHAALTELAAALLERLNAMPAGTIPEPLAMEFTTALLLAESAFENYANLSSEFPQQVQTMLARLEAAAAGRPAPGDATSLGNLGRRAQERMIVSQVGHEIRANLHHMEELLDEFFRDETKRPTLASLAKDSRQVHGALRILGLDDADRLLSLCDERIQAYAVPEAKVPSDELDLLAESLCGLEFYFEAIEQQRLDAHRLIAPLVARWLGEEPPQAVEESESVESAVAALRAELPRLMEAAQGESHDARVRDELRAKLAGLKDDAELIGDEELALQAGAAIAELERGGGVDLAVAVQAIAGSPRAPEISEETQRLLDKDASGRDAGLLDIYLTEATKVLAAIGEALAAMIRNPDDRHALDAVRRGFHTLKESGRMVGLSELSDLAGEVEAIHDRLAQRDRPISATVVAMIDTARTSFRDWVDVLRRSGHVEPDAGKLRAALHVVESELAPSPTVPAIEAHKPAAIEPPKPPTSEAPKPPAMETPKPVAIQVDAGPAAAISITVPPIVEAPAHSPAIRVESQHDASKSTAKKDIWSVALVQPTSTETLTGVHDEIDADLVTRFLDEATRLLPAARQELSAWRHAPLDDVAADRLRRTLHAFKGGARMAGAMRLGQLLQSMESRLVTCEHRAAPPELFQALDIDLDFIGYMLERLTAGESNVVLPRFAPKAPVEAKPVQLPEPSNVPPPELAPAPAPVELALPTLHDDAQPVLATNLAELGGRMTGLRTQIREIEVQTELSVRSRMTELTERGGECDSSELDSLTQIQDLAHSLAEALDGLSAVHQSLLHHVDGSGAVPAQRRGSPAT